MLSGFAFNLLVRAGQSFTQKCLPSSWYCIQALTLIGAERMCSFEASDVMRLELFGSARLEGNLLCIIHAALIK